MTIRNYPVNRDPYFLKGQFMKRDNALPDFRFNRLTDIEPADVKAMGVKALAVDLDNTAVKDSSYRMIESTRAWADKMKEAGIPIIVVSNTFLFRALWLSYKMGKVPFVPFSFKPFVPALKIAAWLAGTEIGSLAMIGDQLFTDVLCANRAGAVSVKVEPMEDEILFASHFRKVRKKEEKYLSENGI